MSTNNSKSIASSSGAAVIPKKTVPSFLQVAIILYPLFWANYSNELDFAQKKKDSSNA